MKYSMELLQKPVISADKNEKMGRINGFIIDPDTRSLSAYLLEPRPNQKSFVVVPYSNTKTIYHDAVIVENLPEPLALDKAPHIMELFVRDVTLIGCQVVTDTGKLAGEIKDFAFEIKTGDLKRLRMEPQPGFPESFEMSLAIKIAKERVMVRGDIYDPNLAKSKPPRPKPRPAAPPPQPAPPAKPQAPAPETPAPAAPVPLPKKSSVGPAPFVPQKQPAPEPEPEPAQTPRVDAVRMQLLADELRKDLRQEVRELSETVLKDSLRESMQEMSRMLLERINALETGDKLDKMRQALADDIQGLLPAAPAADPAAQQNAMQQALERALEAQVAQKLQAAEARAADAEKAIQQLSERQAQLVPELEARLRAALEPLSAELRDNDSAGSSAAQALASVEKAMAGLGETLSANMRALKAGTVDPERLAGLLDAQTAKFQDRANALRQSFIDDVRELAVSMIEERLRAMGDRVAADMGAFREEIAGVPAAVKDAVKQFQARAAAFDTRLESAGDAALAVQSLKAELNAALDKSADALAQKIDSALQLLQAASAPQSPDPATLQIRDSVLALGQNMDTMRNDLNAQLTRTFEKLSMDWERDREAAAMLQHSVQAALDALPERFDALAGLPGEMQEIASRVDRAAADVAGAMEQTVLKQSEAATERMRELLAPMAEALNASDNREPIREFLDSAMDRLEQGLAALRHDFTGGPEGLGGLFMQQLERMDAAVGNRTANLAAQQEQTLSRVDALADAVQARFDGIIASLEDALRREIAGYDENAAARASDLKDALKKTREQFLEHIASLSGDKFDALKKDLLDEIRTYSDAAVKSEDLVQTRDWLDSTIQSLMKSLARESEEKLGRALTQLNRFQEEIAMDAGQFRHEVQELRERFTEALDQKLAASVDDLQQRLDMDRVRESVFSQIADTAKRTTDAARTDIEHLQDLIRGILVAMEEARENEPDPVALRQDIEAIIIERLHDMAGRLEQRVTGAAGESVAAAVAVEQAISRRDAALQKALDTIQEALEKLLTRGPALSLGDMFGGGLMNMFGGRGGREPEPGARSDDTLRIGDSPAQQARERRKPGPSGAVEAAQVRRLSYLVGKTVTRSIEDKDGGLIAGQGDTVDEAMIRAARDAHKVLDLIRAVDLSRR